MAYPLLLGAGFAIATSAWVLNYQKTWARPLPRVDVRFDVVGRKIAEPVRVSAAEEYPGPDGQTIYLTEEQFRAVSMAAGLSNEAGPRLAAAFAEKDPEAQADKLYALVDDAARAPERDRELVGMYRLVAGALAALPEGFKRDAAIENIDRLVGCRYVGPKIPSCPDRPTFTTAYVLGAAAGVPWLVVLGGIVVALVARTRASTTTKPARKAATKAPDSVASDAEEAGAESEAETEGDATTTDAAPSSTR